MIGLILSIANYFTFIRIVISPLFLLVYLYHDLLGITATTLPYVLIFLLCVSELSDAFDGYLARKYNQVTDLGKILDPMADSIARLSYFLTFSAGPVKLPLALVFIFLYRDSVVSTLRTICALKGFALAARTSGKIKAGIQAFAALAVLIMMALQTSQIITIESLQFYSALIVGIAGLYTAYSGIDYIYANREHILRMLTIPPVKHE